MHRFIFSTADIPEAERFAQWRETISQGLFGTSPEKPPASADLPFNANIEALTSGSVAYARYQASPYRIRRGSRDVARVSWADSVMLYRNKNDGVRINCSGMEFVARAGDMFVADPTLSLELTTQADYNEEVMFLPRAMLEPHLRLSGLRSILNFKDDNGVAGLARTYFDGFVRRMETLDERELVSVTDTFCRLLTLARISHGIRCIGAENQRKFFCENNLRGSRRSPRCRRSVDRIRRRLHVSKAVAWSPISTAAR